MSEKTFSKVMRGLEETKAHIAGAREDYEATMPSTIAKNHVDSMAHTDQLHDSISSVAKPT